MSRWYCFHLKFNNHFVKYDGEKKSKNEMISFTLIKINGPVNARESAASLCPCVICGALNTSLITGFTAAKLTGGGGGQLKPHVLVMMRASLLHGNWRFSLKINQTLDHSVEGQSRGFKPPNTCTTAGLRWSGHGGGPAGGPRWSRKVCRRNRVVERKRF